MRRLDPSQLDSQLYNRDFLQGRNATELRAIGDVVRALFRSKFLIAAAVVLGAVLAFLFSRTLEDEYTSTARVMIDTRVQTEGGISSADTILPISLTSLESEAEVLRSLDLVERVIDTLDLQQDPEFAPVDEQAASSDDESEGNGPASNETEGGLADRAKGLVNAILARLPEGGSGEEAAPEAEGNLTEILDKQMVIQAVAERLSVEQLSSVSAVYTISFTSTDRLKAPVIANAFAEQYLAMQLQTKLDALDRSTTWLNDRTREVNERLAELNSELEAHMLDAPFASEEDLANARTQRNRLATRLNQTSAADSGTRAELEAALATLTAALTAQGAHEAETTRLENEIEVTETIYSNVVAQLGVMQQQDDILRTDAQIISEARPAVYPSSISTKMIVALGGIGAAFLACAAIAFFELRQRNLRTVSDFEETTGMPVISLVPRSRGRNTPICALINRKMLADDRLEKCARKLKSSLAASGREQQVIAFVSALQGEGKSSTALLLAQACARTGERTLLLDLDFWRSPYRSFISRGAPGFDHIMAYPETLADHVRRAGDQLDILPATRNTEAPSDIPYSRHLDGFMDDIPQAV